VLFVPRPGVAAGAEFLIGKPGCSTVNEQHLTAHHRNTLQHIFTHPLAHNLEWAEVTSLIDSLGSVIDRHNGEYAFDVGNQRAFFRRPHGKTLDGHDVARLRKFLGEAGITAESVPRRTVDGTKDEQPQAFVVVADHHLARVFALADGGKEIVELEQVTPDDPRGFRRHLEHKKEADYRGERIPEDRTYYERIANALKRARTVLLIGDSSGKSSAVAYLSEYLAELHNDVFRRIVGTVDADLSALSEGQIKTIAAGVSAQVR
jgi:hypothetical protein